ncbi:MAG: argininosuccinate synthase domain-containing protein [Ruminococcus sp.]
MLKKVVLAYSGGLDTSIIIPWLKEHYNTARLSLSQTSDRVQNWTVWRKRRIKTGASKLYRSWT